MAIPITISRKPSRINELWTRSLGKGPTKAGGGGEGVGRDEERFPIRLRRPIIIVARGLPASRGEARR
jgi:hypothetical protein